MTNVIMRMAAKVLPFLSNPNMWFLATSIPVSDKKRVRHPYTDHNEVPDKALIELVVDGHTVREPAGVIVRLSEGSYTLCLLDEDLTKTKLPLYKTKKQALKKLQRKLIEVFKTSLKH